MSKTRRILLPVGAGLAGAIFLFALYIGLVSWAESPKHAFEYLWQDRWLVTPIILGFGIQVALFVVLRTGTFLPRGITRPHGMLTGASGVTSTVGMAACCAHHVADVLPIIGLTSAASFLAAYRSSLMLASLLITLLGITLMLIKLMIGRRKALQVNSMSRVSEV